MIKKNKLFIFPILAVLALFFLSTVSEKREPLSSSLILKEETYAVKSFKYEKENIKKATPSFKSRIRFAKSLQKNNLTAKLNDASKKAEDQSNEDFTNDEEISSQSEEKKNDEQKTASNDKSDKEEKKDEDDDKEFKKETKESFANNESSEIDSLELSSTVEEEHSSSTSIISGSNVHNITQLEEQETLQEEVSEAVSGTSATATSSGENTSLSLFSKTYFTGLLEENKLIEFSEALQLDLTEEQISAAYSSALTTLFEKSDDEFIIFDQFVKSQFLQHRFALGVADSFNQDNISTAEIEYSADLLNQLVFAWSFESQQDSEFNSIYQVAVIDSIPNTLLSNDSIITLRDNINSAALEISDSSLELSSI